MQELVCSLASFAGRDLEDRRYEIHTDTLDK